MGIKLFAANQGRRSMRVANGRPMVDGKRENITQPVFFKLVYGAEGGWCHRVVKGGLACAELQRMAVAQIVVHIGHAVFAHVDVVTGTGIQAGLFMPAATDFGA